MSFVYFTASQFHESTYTVALTESVGCERKTSGLHKVCLCAKKFGNKERDSLDIRGSRPEKFLPRDSADICLQAARAPRSIFWSRRFYLFSLSPFILYSFHSFSPTWSFPLSLPFLFVPLDLFAFFFTPLKVMRPSLFRFSFVFLPSAL